MRGEHDSSLSSFSRGGNALSEPWPAGKVTGLRARGGYEVSLEWKDGKLVSAKIKNISGQGTMPVRYGEKVVEVKLKRGKTKTIHF